ncbi:T9SS type A sorting domain-containing protein [Polaribacter sp. L3A8]|uniref:T9SS type A sorting domain-containing protein n=1 Tax=Polaribacter sp. L3A8 TaxID=2686361 RepID=UPI00131AAF47|nr:T9SS type A sorting domain-containing protein [Polaribacter sp. L3A8]
MKKITLFTLFTLSISVGFSQINVQDFEGSNLEFIKGGVTTLVVENPSKTGLNTSDNCLQFSRNDNSKWWAFATIPVDPIATISVTDNPKFLSIMVRYSAQSDLGVRFNANEDKPAGTESGIIRALNTYDASAPDTWQEIVWEIKDDKDAFAFTLGSLDRLVFHPDMGFVNVPAGQVLSTTKLAYIDNIRILDENPLATASINDASLEDAFSIYPSAVSSVFTVKTTKTISDISIFSVLGKNVTNNLVKLENETYNISSLSSGMYIVKITSENGNFITKKIIKE